MGDAEVAEAGCPLGAFPYVSKHPLEPPEEWAALRSEGCPVPEVALGSGGTPVRVLARYAEVHAMLSDPRFARDPGGTGEQHQLWRRLLGRVLTGKQAVALRPRIAAIGHALVDAMEAGPRPADLMAGFADPLPVRVIGVLLGVPERGWERFAYWSGTLYGADGYGEREIRTAHEELMAYLGDHVARKRREPGDDLISQVIGITEAAGRDLPDAVLVRIARG